MAVLLIGKEDWDAALDALEKAIDGDLDDRGRIRQDPELEPLRGNPRFEALVERTGT